MNSIARLLYKNKIYSHLWKRNKEEKTISIDNVEASSRVRESKEDNIQIIVEHQECGEDDYVFNDIKNKGG